MVKTLLIKPILGLVVMGCCTWVSADGITSVGQCMNTNLTADILRQFPSNATSAVQNCVLAFIKGSVNGDLNVFAEPFSPEIRFSEFGISDLDNISAATRNEFSALMASVSNCTCKVVSYSEMTNNGIVKASITLHRQGAGYNRVEVAHLDMAQTNTFWRIVNWDVDE